MSNGKNSNSMCLGSNDQIANVPSNMNHSSVDQIRSLSKNVKECIDIQEEERDELESLEHMLNRLTVVNAERREKSKSVKKKMDRLLPNL